MANLVNRLFCSFIHNKNQSVETVRLDFMTWITNRDKVAWIDAARFANERSLLSKAAMGAKGGVLRMVKLNQSDFGRLVLVFLFQCLFALPIAKMNTLIHVTTILQTATKKPFVCPWYCYPVGIFMSLIALIFLTICISGCDYHYLKNHQPMQVTRQKTTPREKEAIESVSEKVSQKTVEDEDEGGSMVSADSDNA
jgi:hypothetical protein